MARLYRFDHEGALHHVMSRGVEKRSIVLDDLDRDDFTRRLGECSSETGMRIHAWVLMPNHFHLLTETGTTNLARFMQKLLTGHAVRFNRRYDRVGHLFQGRYRSILVQSEQYFSRLLRYIHLNPLKAGLVQSIESLKDYPWSGHVGILDPQINLWQFRKNLLDVFGDGPEGLHNYLSFLSQPDPCDGSVFDSGNFFIGTDGIVERNTASHPTPNIDRHLPILGTRGFSESIMQRLTRRRDTPPIRCRGHEHRKALLIIQLVEVGLGLSKGTLRKRGRNRAKTTGRMLASYCLLEYLGLTLKDAAGVLKISRQGVHYLNECYCENIEVNNVSYKQILENIINALRQVT